MVNVECAIIATKKKSETLETGGRNPPKGLTPAEDLALALNRGRPFIHGRLLLTACLAYPPIQLALF